MQYPRPRKGWEPKRQSRVQLQMVGQSMPRYVEPSGIYFSNGDFDRWLFEPYGRDIVWLSTSTTSSILNTRSRWPIRVSETCLFDRGLAAQASWFKSSPHNHSRRVLP